MISNISFDFFSIKGGIGIHDTWVPSVGNSWRTTNDIQDNWFSMIDSIDLVRLIIL
jgi:hypothetical protein